MVGTEEHPSGISFKQAPMSQKGQNTLPLDMNASPPPPRLCGWFNPS